MVQIFNNNEFGSVRTIEENGKVMFVASDVAKILGYARPADAVSSHCRYTAKCSIPHPQGRGTLEMNIIPESDMYRLIVAAADQSQSPAVKEKADKFERWVFDEVLPTIRRNGMYVVPQPSVPNASALINGIGDTSEALQRVFGLEKGMSLVHATKIYREDYGIDTSSLEALLPAREDPTNIPKLNATSIGEMFDIGEYRSATMINRALTQLGWQAKVKGEYTLTDEGKPYGEAFPYENNGHSGFQILWTHEAAEEVINYVIERPKEFKKKKNQGAAKESVGSNVVIFPTESVVE